MKWNKTMGKTKKELVLEAIKEWGDKENDSVLELFAQDLLDFIVEYLTARGSRL
jgi:hypothetical protein